MIKETNFESLKNFNIKETTNPFTKYIAYFDKEILGYIEYNDIYETIDIVNVFVKENKRGKGIGEKLLTFLIKENKDKKNITLEVSKENNPALNLYKKVGFEIVGTRKGYYKGIDGYLMELKL